MAIYEVDVPKRDFAIGDTWASKMGPSSRSLDAPQNCIVCGAVGNNCTGDEHATEAAAAAAPAFDAAA